MFFFRIMQSYSHLILPGRTVSLPNLSHNICLFQCWTERFIAHAVHNFPLNISSSYPSGNGLFQHSHPHLGQTVSVHVSFWGIGTFFFIGIIRYPPLSVFLLGLIFTYIFNPHYSSKNRFYSNFSYNVCPFPDTSADLIIFTGSSRY